MDLTFEDVKQELRRVKLGYDLAEDISFYNENIEALRSGDFQRMRDRLNKSIEKYGTSIKQLSLFTKVTLVQYPVLTDEIVSTSLVYLTSNIPFYVAFEKLKEKAWELLMKKLGV